MSDICNLLKIRLSASDRHDTMLLELCDLATIESGIKLENGGESDIAVCLCKIRTRNAMEAFEDNSMNAPQTKQ